MINFSILNPWDNLTGRRVASVFLSRRFTALVLIGSLLAPSATLAKSVNESDSRIPQAAGSASFIGAVVSTIATFLEIAPWGQDRGMSPFSRSARTSRSSQRPPTREERVAKVKGLAVNPQGEVVLEPEQPQLFMAIPVDAEGRAIQGLTAEWESSDSRIVFVSPHGEASGVRPGVARLTAKVGNKRSTVNVIVRRGSGEKFGGKKQDSTRGRQARVRTRTSRPDVRFIAASGRHSRLSMFPARFEPATAKTVSPAAAPLFNRAPDDDPLPDSDTGTLYNTDNEVGAPPGRTEPGAATPPAAVSSGTETPGSANFSLSVPVVGLSGRGPGVSLALSYNSRLWHKSGANLTYDVDSGWPAPGFRLGYGQMEDQGSHGFTLTDPNGTRHEMAKTGPISSSDYNSTDGTFIHFRGGRGWGTATYTDGTRIDYGAAGNGFRSYPVKVLDRNGNFISISYVNNVGPRILSIQDTLGRYVRFNYEGDDLASVTAPKLAGTEGEETTTIRFYYGTIDLSEATLQSLFDTATVTPHAPSTARVVRYVYYPGTGSGYRYDYSPYGMIRQIVQLRGMQTANFNLNPLASESTDGQQAASTVYDYPTGGAALTDAPKYGSRTDDWVGRTSAQPVYQFVEDEAAGITRVIAPDGSVSETKTITAPPVGEEWSIGLIEETQLKASPETGAAVLARTRFKWEQGENNRNPRLEKVWTTDETGETRAVVYDEHDAYNNVLVSSEHDFAAYPDVGAELRRTETDYMTSTNYINRRLVRLPVQVRVVASGQGLVSRVDYGYDETALVRRGENPITGHDQAFNPEAPEVRRCRPSPQCDPEDFDCGCQIVPQYDPATDYRGNVTSIKSYSNAATPAAGTTTTNTAVYDILGNVTEQTVNCCRKKTFTYTDSYKFAYPETETRGESPLQLSTSAVYDFNTGLVTSTKDENNQETTISYNVETLRPTHVVRPAGGGSTEFFHEEGLVNGPGNTPRYSRSSTKTYFESGRAVESFQYFDGRGAEVRSFHSYTSAQGWVTADVEYDVMGRAWRTSNPYYSAGATDEINPPQLWTTNSLFDKLGRVTEMTLPDGAKVTSQFAGKVMTVTDQAGRQRRQLRDALGRIIEMHEPDAAGSLGTATSPVQQTVYEYDGLDNVTKVRQAGGYRDQAAVTQERVFKYDSLSRLTHQRQVEETARLNDAGEVVTTGGQWSRVTKYDAWGNVTDGYDALGVHTHIEYDTLNRVDVITYSDGTPTLDYTYDEARADAQGQPYANRGRLTRVETAAVENVPMTVQEYDYDRLGRTGAQRQSVGAATYTLGYKYNWAGQLTEQTYPSGRVVKQVYDDAARLLSTGNADGTQVYASGLKYAAHGGLLSESSGNGTVAEMGYNSRLQVTEHTLKRGSATSAEVIQRYVYKYGQMDQATGTVDEAKNAGQIGKVESYIGGTMATPTKQWEQRFSYDTLSRLTQASERRADTGQAAWQLSYDYDRFGNRYQHTTENQNALAYTPVEAADVDRTTNRIVAPTTTTPGIEYDHAGHVTRDTKFRQRRYAYDANGRMTWTANLDETGATTAVYDGLGQRVQTMYAGQPRVMVYDISGKIVAEYGQAEADGGGLRYVFQDHQGSTRAVLDAQGQVKARRDYAPFGEDVGAAGTRSGVAGYNSADETRQQYALTERDKETGLDHTPWRKYDSAAGRWTSPDPYLGSMNLDDPQSFNRYAYVGNDPVNLVDPSGLNASECSAEYSYEQCGGDDGFWGESGRGGVSGYGYGFGNDRAMYHDMESSGMPAQLLPGLLRYEQSVNNAIYGGDSSGGESFQVQYWLYDDGTLVIEPFRLSPVTVTANLAWHQRGILGPVGDFSRGVADTVTFGITERIHESRGEPRPDTGAFQAGSMAGFFVPYSGPGSLFGRLGIRVSGHFLTRLTGRAARGVTEGGALRAYTRGRLYFDEASRRYIRHDTRTGISVVVDRPSGGNVITVFEGNPSPRWNPVPWRPGR